MKLIVGLGNPGEKYQETRHNLGFMVLDGLLAKLTTLEKTVWEEKKRFNSLLFKKNNLLLVKPQTFMNASGLAVVQLANFYKIEPEDIWLVHDDVDFPLGKIKIKQGGVSAGHRGVDSVIEKLGSDQMIRFRLGIGHPVRGEEREVERYVLGKFGSQELSKARKMIKKTVKVVQLALEEGLEKAMNQYH